MSLRSALVVSFVLLLNGLVWSFFSQPSLPQEVRMPLDGVSYNPYQRSQDPWSASLPTRQDIIRDLDLLKGRTESIRIYRASQGFEGIPSLAKKRGLDVIVSAYLSGTPGEDEAEVRSVIKIAQSNRNVPRVILGNETQLQKSVPPQVLVEYLRRARKALRTPVSTAEPWDFWLNHPEMVQEVDFIAIHILPYWKEIPASQAVEYVLKKYRTVQDAYPQKSVVIAETGWPSDGPQRGPAEPNQINQAEFIRTFVQKARDQRVPYNIIEAFDQPWKSQLEGRAGEHWGMMTAARSEKFPLSGPVLEYPEWRAWAGSAAALGALFTVLYLARRPRLSFSGEALAVLMIQIVVTGCVLLAQEATGEYFSSWDVIFWSATAAGQALLACIFLSDTAEMSDVVGDRPLKQRYPPATAKNGWVPPFVSLHLACCKEPPELVIATLKSLAKLEYPEFEVIVVDNNTADDSIWMPLERCCAQLGGNFRFYSLGKWPGFKAGALNFALKVTDPRACIIGVVDADYLVSRDWLRATVPYFDNGEIAVVQAPQEHRDWTHSTFQRMENDEYSGFFRIGMVQRNEHNAIIQHGTLSLVRRKVLNELKGWAEWCICEDAELGLRVLLQGKRNIYIDHPFGFGLVPDSYQAYATQRFRWAYGAMRILRRYWKELIGLKPGLSGAQRYHFIKGWLPWLGDGLHGVFTVAALIWSAVLIYDPLKTDFPEPIFVFPAVALVLLRVVATSVTYVKRVRIGAPRTLLAMIAGSSLTHTVAHAVVQGLLTSVVPFHRTPKLATCSPLFEALLFVYQEILLGALLIAAVAGILIRLGSQNHDGVVWCIALLIQALPYCAAVITSTISAYGRQTPSLQSWSPSVAILGEAAREAN